MSVLDRGVRRKRDFIHAIRKKKKSDSVLSDGSIHPWYDNLHQYSKGKIHCSCPICRNKTRNNGVKERTIADQRKLQDIHAQMNDPAAD